MTIRRYTAHCIVIGLLAAEILVLGLSPAPRRDDRSGLTAALPAAVGEFKGLDILFCHNEPCALTPCLTSELKDPGRCPRCGAALHTRSLGEQRLLPEDTEIMRKIYSGPGREYFHVTVVVSGRDRQSIHRPQFCLPGQGNTIVNERVVRVPCPGGAQVSLMFLDLKRSDQNAGAAGRSCYAYWFVTHGHETPSHLARLFWMAWDTLVHNTRTRWAYVSVAADSRGDNATDVKRMQQFVGALYPLIKAPQ